MSGSTTTIKLKQWQQQQQQYMTHYWPNFDQTLKLGFCDQQWQQQDQKQQQDQQQ